MYIHAMNNEYMQNNFCSDSVHFIKILQFIFLDYYDNSSRMR